MTDMMPVKVDIEKLSDLYLEAKEKLQQVQFLVEEAMAKSKYAASMKTYNHFSSVKRNISSSIKSMEDALKTAEEHNAKQRY